MVAGQAASEEVALYVQRPACGRQRRSTRTAGRGGAGTGSSARTERGEERAGQCNTYFMYASSGNFSVTSAVERMRSKSSAHGSARCSPTAVELVGDDAGRVAALGRDAVGVVVGLAGVLEKVNQSGLARMQEESTEGTRKESSEKGQARKNRL
jgi:hypothetical protein